MGKRGREEKRGPPRQFDNRQARKQADRLENDGMDGDLNIWYGPRKKRRGKDKAPARCDPGLDAGVTRGSEASALEFCVFFARGACARGYSCHKLHFVPTQEDDAREDNMHDCFGRERSGVEDDDRDGPGCFLKENRTLWVGGVPAFDEAAARERVRQNFGAWGRISSVRLVKNKSCAFVQYICRANAEFAKEAMSNQALLTTDQMASSRATAAAAAQGRLGKGPGPSRPPSTSAGGDIGGGGVEDGPVLHVRWAAEDPNPRAVMRAREGHAQTLLAAQVATGALPPDVTGRLPGADRALLRKAGMSMSNPSQVDLEFQNTQRQYLAVQAHAADGGQYPDTDHQYPNTDHQYPSTDHQYPNTDQQYPSTDHQYPNTDQQYPSADHQYPNTDHQYPGASHQYPSTDPQYPNKGYQYPSAEHRYETGAASASPAVGARTPSSMGRIIRAAGGAASPHVAPAGGAPDSAIGAAGGSDGRKGQENDAINAKAPGGGGPEQPSSPAAAEAAAAGVGKGPGRTAVAGGSLSLLGGYGSDDSD